MISILTGVVVMVAMGTVLQRADGIPGLGGFGGDDMVLNDDVAVARINSLLRVDVLANDEGVSRGDNVELQLVGMPECGFATVNAGAVEYLADRNCSGLQKIRYGIKGQNTFATVSAEIQPTATTAKAAPSAPEATATAPEAKVAVAATATQEPLTDDLAGVVPVSDTDDAPSSAAVTTDPTLADIKGYTPEVPKLVALTTPTGGADGGADEATALIRGGGLAVGPDQTGNLPSALKPDDLLQTKVTDIAADRTAMAPVHAAVPAVPEGVEADMLIAALQSATAAPEPVPALRNIAAVTKDIDTVVDMIGATPRPLRDKGTGDIEIAARTVAYDITPVVLGSITGPAGIEPAKEDLQAEGMGLLSFVGLGSSDASNGDFLVAIVEPPFEPIRTPAVPVHALVGEPVEPDVAIKDDIRVGAEAALIAAAPAPSVAVTTSTGVEDALIVDPVDLTQEAYVEPQPEAETVATIAPVANSPATDAAAPAAGDAAQPANTGFETPSDDTATEVAALNVDTDAETDVEPAGAAADPAATAACVVPASVKLAKQRAAQTRVDVAAPCSANSVAEISYSGLRLAVGLDDDGNGRIIVPGFSPRSAATLTFEDGEVLEFDLPFRDTARISRVALVWDAPVELELNAFEFGAQTGDADHISPRNPRTLRDIRKTGGGFLTAHASAQGVGQNAQIYTHLHRAGGRTGVVKMMIDFASRRAGGEASTCGAGAHATPQFQVRRLEKGSAERLVSRQLASVDCSDVTSAEPENMLISGAVEDLMINPK